MVCTFSKAPEPQHDKDTAENIATHAQNGTLLQTAISVSVIYLTQNQTVILLDNSSERSFI